MRGMAHALDLKGMTEEEKLRKIEKHPNAVLLMTGHAMFYSGNDGKDHFILHANSAVREGSAESEPTENFSVVRTKLDSAYTLPGRSYLDAIHTMVVFE